ncbi:hypothetical protein LMG28727_06286 [Paraburkholderia kirstenboschensis]|nr:hypothetical protein LMG28727_06286 [Paraburkholderia kirstenboschensis]
MRDGIESFTYADLQQDIADVVAATRAAAARSVNSIMTASYWAIGRRIVEFEQGGAERATYGAALIRRLGTDLSKRLGRGFGSRNLAQMRAFYLAWPVDRIVQTLSAQSADASMVQTLSAFCRAIGFQSGREQWTRVRRNHTGVSATVVCLRSSPLCENPRRSYVL